MATIRWANKHRAIYSDPKQWVGGVIPAAEDTAAISSAGDAAPTLGALTPLLMRGTTGSEAYICGSTSLAQETTEYYNEGNGQTLATSSTPREDILPESLTIAGGTIDLLGAGSDAALARVVKPRLAHSRPAQSSSGKSGVGEVSEALAELQLALDAEAAAKKAVAVKLSKLTRLLSVPRSARSRASPAPAAPVLVIDNAADARGRHRH